MVCDRLMLAEHGWCPSGKRFSTGGLAQVVERVHRFTALPQLERDLAALSRRDPERPARGNRLPDCDIERPEPGNKAGPAIGMFDDHDPAIAAIGPGKGDPSRTGGDDLRARARALRYEPSMNRRWAATPSGSVSVGHLNAYDGVA